MGFVINFENNFKIVSEENNFFKKTIEILLVLLFPISATFCTYGAWYCETTPSVCTKIRLNYSILSIEKIQLHKNLTMLQRQTTERLMG